MVGSGAGAGGGGGCPTGGAGCPGAGGCGTAGAGGCWGVGAAAAAIEISNSRRHLTTADELCIFACSRNVKLIPEAATSEDAVETEGIK